MRQCVDTRSRRQSLRYIHHQICVYDRNVRQKFVICKRIFSTAIFVGDNGKRRNFRTCTCRSSHCDKGSLIAHMREGVYSLTDIHKSHCKVLEIDFGMLIKYPHNLTCVHCRATAYCNDYVRLEFLHSLSAFHCATKRWIRSYVEERSVSNIHFVQSIGDSLCKSALIQERVSYDKRLFLSHNVFEFSQCNAKTTLFEIYLFRRSKPQHILSPFCYCLYIYKVLYSNVFAYAVTAPASATECE